MARTSPAPKPPKNNAPKDIVIEGSGAKGSILVSDQSDSSSPLASLTVIDRDALPELRDNLLSVSDDRFEIRDGNLYLKEGVTLPAGKLKISITAVDATNSRLSHTEKISLEVTHTSPAATLSEGTLILNADGAASVTRNEDGGWHLSVAGKGMDLSAAQVDAIGTIVLHGANTLDLAGAAVSGRTLAVNGQPSETVNISGVTFTESTAGVSIDSNTDISHLSIHVNLLVNNTDTDAFKAMWNYLDDAYAYLQSHYGNTLMFGLNGYTETELLPGGMAILGKTEIGAAALAVNKAVTGLDIAYAQYLNAGGPPADLVDFTAKTNAGGTRFQSIHDNLLGSVSAAAIGDRNFPSDVRDTFVARIPADYGSRPYASGNLDAFGHTDAFTNAAKAWDYAHGIDRPDYVTHYTGPIDASATQPDGSMWFGAGNPSSGYTIAVHDGSGVEFGWNVHYRTGDQISGHVGEDGLVHFNAPAGHQSGTDHNVQGDNLNRSAVSLDYAVVTSLNGTSDTVSDYVVKVLLDLNPGAGQTYKAFTMQTFGAGVNVLVADDSTGGVGDEDGTNPNLSENSINFGYAFLTNSLTGSTGDFQAGTYDMIAQIYEGDVLLMENHIVLDLVGVPAA